MNTKSIKKFVSGLLAAAACITSISFTAITGLSAKAEHGRTLPNGLYHIRNLHSGKCMDVRGAWTHNGAEVIQYGYHGDLNQTFRVTLESDGYYSIKPMHCPSAAIDLRSKNEANTNGTDAQIWEYSSGYNEQKFIIKSALGGGFQIGTASSGGQKVLEVDSSSCEDCAPIQVWNYSTTRMNDNWAFERATPTNVSYFALTNDYSRNSRRIMNKIINSFNDLGYGNLGYSKDNEEVATRDGMQDMAGSSSVLVFHGHGNVGFMSVNNDFVFSSELGDIISPNTWKHVSLAYFGTCYSAERSNDRTSLVHTAYELGATCSMGFKYTVTGAEDYLMYMMQAVENNPDITIHDAVIYANSQYTYNEKQNISCPAHAGNLIVTGNDLITLRTR